MPFKDTPDPNNVNYYHLLDLGQAVGQTYGNEFVAWLLATLKPNQFLFDLAEESGVVLLPGLGFGTNHPSARVSLANLTESQYVKIGMALRSIAERYYTEFSASRKKTGKGKNNPARSMTLPGEFSTTLWVVSTRDNFLFSRKENEADIREYTLMVFDRYIR